MHVVNYASASMCVVSKLKSGCEVVAEHLNYLAGNRISTRSPPNRLRTCPTFSNNFTVQSALFPSALLSPQNRDQGKHGQKQVKHRALPPILRPSPRSNRAPCASTITRHTFFISDSPIIRNTVLPAKVYAIKPCLKLPVPQGAHPCVPYIQHLEFRQLHKTKRELSALKPPLPERSSVSRSPRASSAFVSSPFNPLSARFNSETLPSSFVRTPYHLSSRSSVFQLVL